MPSILLINDNKIVSRLLQLSSEKNGYNLEEVTILDNSGGSYDVVFIDSDRYSDELMREIESKLKYGKLGYIGVKQETVPEGFDIVIEKPFLPTDFVDIIKEQVIGSISEKEETFDEDENLEMESLDLDDEADVLLDEDSLDLESFDDDVEDLLVSDDDQDDEISLDDLDALDDVDLSLDPATVMTTGVAASMAMSDNNPEELADMVSEVEDMNEDELKPLDEEIVLESEPEVELESESQKPLDMDSEDFEDDISELTREATELEESKEGISGLEVAAGAAAVVGAVASGAIASTDSLEVVEDKDIEKEVSKLDDLVELNEADLQQALGEEVTEVAEETAEEIISEEIISDGEETMVESNEVEKWIRDAVAKAITPEMIKEALDGMDINVTLNFSSKKEDDATS
jgi:uncharacterized membrane protein